MYTTFWCLSLYDIFTPREEYDIEIERVRNRHDSLKRGEETLTARKRQIEIDRCVNTVAGLKRELSDQINNHNVVLDRLRSTKDKWFPVELNRKAAVREFLQSCILPRALFSAEDALFCAKFVSVSRGVWLNDVLTLW
jgi:THO complex subunit 2